MQLSDLPEILSVKEVADYLRLDIKSVYQGIGKGEIPGKRIGKRVIVHRDTLLKWLSSNGLGKG